MSEQKLLPEEQQKLLELQNRWTFLTRKYGELFYQSKLIQRELSKISDALDQLEDDRVTTINQLQTKYGAGQIDINNGVFVSDEVPTT